MSIVDGLAHAVATLVTGLLHLVGVDVAREGCRIAYRGRCLVVASECSGIRSLCAITVTMLLAGLLWRYGVGRTIGLVAMGAAAAIVFNVLRVASCVVFPAAHDLSGYVAFGAALGATFWMDSCSRPLKALYKARRDAEEMQP